jgi:uncharacterized protein (DUF58 family)
MHAGRFHRWLDRRIPPAPRVLLGQRSIFIFPNATGFAFGGLVALLLLAAINYQNSLIYGLAFLLISLFLVTILHTYRNLAGLTLEFAGVERGFVGEEIGYAVQVTRPPGVGRAGIQLGGSGLIPQAVSLQAEESCIVKLFLPAVHRGWLEPGRIIVETYYPLGLLRAWSWVDLGTRVLVYPRPIFGEWLDKPAAVADDAGAWLDPEGSDDFNGLREYRAGDPVRHVLWRAFARSGDLVVKQYAGYLEPSLVFDWDHVPGDQETRLSRLAGLVLTAAREGREFALRLPNLALQTGSGERHMHRALEALALYGN